MLNCGDNLFEHGYVHINHKTVTTTGAFEWSVQLSLANGFDK